MAGCERCTDPNSSSSLNAATAEVTKNDKLYQACFLKRRQLSVVLKYEGWNFNSGNYLLTTDTK